MTYEPRTCAACQGAGSHVEETEGDHGARIWVEVSCTACGGQGVR